MKRTVLFIAALTACHSESVTVSMDLTLTSRHALRTSMLALELQVDGEPAARADIVEPNGPTTLDVPELELEVHRFRVVVRTNSNFPGGEIELLSTFEREEEIVSGDNEIRFGPDDFDLAEAPNSDDDDVNDWDEFVLGCDPSNGDCPWRSVSTGYDHTCAIAGNRQLYCFGANEAHQLTGTSRYNATPVGPIDDMKMWRQVVTGSNHTCGITFPDNQVYCWGDGSTGQLGNGDTNGRDSPARVDISGVPLLARKIAAGNRTTCAVTQDDALYCWGWRNFGNPNPQIDRSPTLVDAGPGWTDVAVGGVHQCGVKNHRVLCRGDNADYQVGWQDPVFYPSLFEIPSPSVDWVAVAAGANVTCAVDIDGNLYCWGDNSEGELGNMDGGRILNPTQITSVEGARWHSVSIGENHVCGAHDTRLQCWGLNKHGQLGRADVDAGAKATPDLLEDTDAISFVSAAAHHTCAVRNGELYCWGSHGWGRTGRGLISYVFTPSADTEIAPPGSEHWVEVSAGQSHTCARTNASHVFCWGDNTWGALGAGDFVDDSVVAAGTDPAVTGEWTAIGGGYAYTCGIDVSSPALMSCWGSNADGRLGLGSAGSTNDEPSPMLVDNGGSAPNGNSWTRLSVGPNHACGIEEIKGVPTDLYCWGRDGGALGQGSTASSSTPLQVTGANPWAWVSAGGDPELGDFTCAIDNAGDRYCWGANSLGQLGINNQTSVTTPTQLSGASISWGNRISTGRTHACGLSTTDELFCWGDDAQGQVADGDSNNDVVDLVPIAVRSNVSTWQTVDTGGEHTCAITSGGELRCAGSNASGQLGLNEGVDVLLDLYASVPGIWNWIEVSAGASHTCAIHDPDPDPYELHCWGSSENGQLGLAENPTAGFGAWADTPGEPITL